MILALPSFMQFKERARGVDAWTEADWDHHYKLLVREQEHTAELSQAVQQIGILVGIHEVKDPQDVVFAVLDLVEQKKLLAKRVNP